LPVSLQSPPFVLSIQSHVALGHVGNAAAVFPLQRLGYEVLPVHTVQFSNHTGYGQFRGQVFASGHIREVLLGLRERGALARVAAVLSGYLGDAGTGAVILETVEQIRRDNPQLRYLCDPVMGDVGRGVFVNDAIPDFLRNLAIPCADIITPNQFELSTPDLAPERLSTLGVNAQGAWLVSTPRLDLQPLPNGMGDVFSATLLARLLAGMPLPQALELATSTLYALVLATPSGSRDLPLVAAQEQIGMPQQSFKAVALR
jgi:pyridoxine kinase